jgi:hypothetical protein
MERQVRRRKRPSRSCVECRRRKIKCDRNNPCAHCTSTKTRCVYKTFHNTPVDIQQADQDGSWVNLPQLLADASSSSATDRSNRSEIAPRVTNQASSSCPATLPPSVTAEQSTTPNAINQENRHVLHQAQDAEQDYGDLSRPIPQPEASSVPEPMFGFSETARQILARQSGLQDSQIILNKTRILRWSHWMGMAQEVKYLPRLAQLAFG